MNTPAFSDLKDFDIPTMNLEAWPHVMVYHFAGARAQAVELPSRARE
jgi:hypothetical protein